jgi:hypothetical protein
VPNTPTIYAARAVSPAVDEILDQPRQYRHDHPQGEHVEHQRDEDEDQRGGPRFRRSERDLYVVTANNSNNRDLKGTVFRARSDIPGLPVPRARF